MQVCSDENFFLFEMSGIFENMLEILMEVYCWIKKGQIGDRINDMVNYCLLLVYTISHIDLISVKQICM